MSVRSDDGEAATCGLANASKMTTSWWCEAATWVRRPYGLTPLGITRSTAATASVFAARDVPVDELAQQAPLVRFEVLTLVRVGVLRSAGFRLEPTGRNPRHFTVAFDDLDPGVEELIRCEHRSWVNPYHED